MSDPRDSTLETKFTIPQPWRAQNNAGECSFLLFLIFYLNIINYRWTRCLWHVSRWTDHDHSEQVTNTLSLPRPTHQPLNRFLAWPSLLLGASAWVNQHPLRSKEAGTPPIGNLMSVLHTRVSSNAYFSSQARFFCPCRVLSPPHPQAGLCQASPAELRYSVIMRDSPCPYAVAPYFLLPELHHDRSKLDS